MNTQDLGLPRHFYISAGGNVSLNHVDFMIGSPKMDIDGIKKDGSREPVMRQGEWAIEA